MCQCANERNPGGCFDNWGRISRLSWENTDEADASQRGFTR